MLMHKTAVFSDDGRYRYSLSREWDLRGEQVCWIMLNPSIAGDERDDPTIRRCMGFARKWGYGGIVVVNLFAAIATFPADLAKMKDPVGPHNDEAILQAIKGRRVVCAWGNLGPWLRSNWHRDMTVATMVIDTARTNAHCLGLTKFGYPQHPVRLAGSKTMKPFNGRKP